MGSIDSLLVVTDRLEMEVTDETYSTVPYPIRIKRSHTSNAIVKKIRSHMKDSELEQQFEDSFGYMSGKELLYEDSKGRRRLWWSQDTASQDKVLEVISPDHSASIVMKICWAKSTPVTLMGDVEVINMEESSNDELEDSKWLDAKLDALLERDEKVKDVEDHYNELRDLVHAYQDAVRDRTQGAL